MVIVMSKEETMKKIKDLLNNLRPYLQMDGGDIEFIDYAQYADILLDVAEACDTNKLEFAVKYEDNKGYDKFTIFDVFEG